MKLPGKDIALSLSIFNGVISGVSFILLLLIDSEMLVCEMKEILKGISADLL